jgi:hypothetical protein
MRIAGLSRIHSAGARAGTFASSGPHGVGISCGQEKWGKAKCLFDEIQVELDSSGHLTHKSLEQKRGFFVHSQCTYPCITPFLKGFHLTLDSWRVNRDADGWCISHQPWTGPSFGRTCYKNGVTLAPRVRCLNLSPLHRRCGMTYTVSSTSFLQPLFPHAFYDHLTYR